jgi:hypothetical protein
MAIYMNDFNLGRFVESIRVWAMTEEGKEKLADGSVLSIRMFREDENRELYRWIFPKCQNSECLNCGTNSDIVEATAGNASATPVMVKDMNLLSASELENMGYTVRVAIGGHSSVGAKGVRFDVVESTWLRFDDRNYDGKMIFGLNKHAEDSDMTQDRRVIIDACYVGRILGTIDERSNSSGEFPLLVGSPGSRYAVNVIEYGLGSLLETSIHWEASYEFYDSTRAFFNSLDASIFLHENRKIFTIYHGGWPTTEKVLKFRAVVKQGDNQKQITIGLKSWKEFHDLETEWYNGGYTITELELLSR